MKGYSDSLRGYGHDTHVRCKYTCQYCGFDGRAFPNWLQITVDHIVPIGQGGPDDEDNKVTACQACNSITSRMTFPQDMSKAEILDAKKNRVVKRQQDYFEFWKTHVAPSYLDNWQNK